MQIIFFLRSLLIKIIKNNSSMDSIWSNYRRWNNITGWFIFVISTVVYLLTLEPTVNFGIAANLFLQPLSYR